MKKQEVYNAFLTLILSDEWETMEELEIENDLKAILMAAIPHFKFPRISLEYDQENDDFISELTNNEVQVLAQFMKLIWYGRVVDSWENLRPYYTERDFSPGKMLGEFRGRLSDQERTARKLENVYYRSVNEKPFNYGLMGGRS